MPTHIKDIGIEIKLYFVTNCPPVKQLFTFLLILLLFLVGVGRDLYAQKQGQLLIDSLRQELAKQKEDSNKVTLLTILSMSYHYIDPDSGIKSGTQGLELAKRLDWKPGIAWTMLRIGNSYTVKSDYPAALDYLLNALKIQKEIHDKTSLEENNSGIGYVYRDQGDYQKALEYDFNALKIAEETNDKANIPHLIDAIGSVYKYSSNYPKALEYYLRSLKMTEDLGITADLSIINGDICEVYTHLKNYTLAIKYGRLSLKTTAYSDDYSKAWAFLDLGRAYLAIATDTPAGSNRTHILHGAIDTLLRALEISKQVHSIRTMRICYETIAEAYKLGGDYKKSLEFADISRGIKDSVFSKQNNDKIARIGIEDEYKRKRITDSIATMKTERTTALKLQRQKGYTYAGLSAVLLLLGFSFFIAKERRKAETLLLNILPRQVADELKSNGVTKARHFDNVTVLFTDFVNFTQAAETMSPPALIDELNTCFKAFDEIIGKYDIEKIKTIGDAYLAVCGLPVASTAHAANMIKAAIEMNAFMQGRLAKLGDKTFEIRIGIHSGSVVAGIVGVKKFAYDIWGDTVNTAARMQQNSAAGKINISETTYELVKDKFTCEYRGEVEAKNKGMLKMYFVS